MPGQSKTSPRQPTCCGAPPAGGSLLLVLSGEQVSFASASSVGSCHCGPCFLRSVILWTVLTPEVSGQSVCTFYSIHCKLCFIICSRKKKNLPDKKHFLSVKVRECGDFLKVDIRSLEKDTKAFGLRTRTISCGTWGPTRRDWTRSLDSGGRSPPSEACEARPRDSSL